MWQDLCWPKPTYPSLSLAFIRGEKKKKGETKTTPGEETETGGERREHKKKRSMPSIKQERLSSLKLV